MRVSILALAVLVCLAAAAVGSVSGARAGTGAAADDTVESPMDGKWKTVNYYELLGLDRSERNSLSTSDVTKAYRLMAQRHHPDKFADPAKYTPAEHREAEKRFSRLVDGMKTLRSRESRENYEVLLKAGRLDYSKMHWDDWNEQKWKEYEDYVNNYDREGIERAETDLQLWLAGIPTVAGLIFFVYWTYGDDLKKWNRERERKAKRREEREKAGAAGGGTTELASPTGRRPHKSDKKRGAPNGATSPKA